MYEPDWLDPARPEEVVIHCLESGSRRLLLNAGALPAEFFDLSTGVLGALVHRLSIYGIDMAAVVPDLPGRSQHFQDFVREANTGSRFRFVATRGEAETWLAERQRPEPR